MIVSVHSTMKKTNIILIDINVTLITILVVPVLLYLAGLFFIHNCDPDFLKIDSCLDAGGVWDYENCQCMHSEEALTKTNQ